MIPHINLENSNRQDGSEEFEKKHAAKDEKVIHWAEGCIEGKGLGVIRLRGKLYCYRQQGDFLPGRGFW